jgi:hypothetical protein
LLHFDEAKQLMNIECIAMFRGGSVAALKRDPNLPRPVGVSHGEQPWWDADEILNSSSLPFSGPGIPKGIEGACNRCNLAMLSVVFGPSVEELRLLNVQGRLAGSRRDPGDQHLWWCGDYVPFVID